MEKSSQINIGNEHPIVTDDQLPYAHRLYRIPGVGSRVLVNLMNQGFLPEEIYYMKAKTLEKHLQGRQKKAAWLIAKEHEKESDTPQILYHSLLERQIHYTCIGHASYPDRLLKIPDPPFGLYYLGSLPKQNRPSVAIVGARGCSPYGIRMAAGFGSCLAKAGCQIISGMARGIDGIGQQAALQEGGYSLGILGCGVDICYPKENQALYDALCANGGVCSEYAPGMQPKNTLFPARNRLISGFADVVLVIEARKRSGSLITVDMALEQGKEVYALPGRITDALSEGCNDLIRQGASIALSPEEMLRDMGLGTKIQVQDKSPSVSEDISDTASVLFETSDKFSVTQRICAVLDDTPQSIDEIKEQMLFKFGIEITIPELAGLVMYMNLQGLIHQVGNGYFTIV